MRNGLFADLIGALWATWALYWLWSAAGAKAAQRRESIRSRSAHFIPMLVAGLLLAAPEVPGSGWLCQRFAPASALLAGCGCLAVALGLALSTWARMHLGSNWSGRISLKQEHVLIRTGPYAIVRHPIYSGLLLAMCGTACALGEWRGLLAVLLMAASYWRKLRLEEQLMMQTFGDEYRRYCGRTSALIPHLI
jgi:protein-S-isoprenylcysteine O-methyltransferase Ste14